MSVEQLLSNLNKKENETMDKKEQKRIEAEMTLRGKGWDELTADEKIERMREQIKERTTNQGREISALRAKLDKLGKHDHKDGKVMVELDRFGGGLSDGQCESIGSRKIYF